MDPSIKNSELIDKFARWASKQSIRRLRKLHDILTINTPYYVNLYKSKVPRKIVLARVVAIYTLKRWFLPPKHTFSVKYKSMIRKHLLRDPRKLTKCELEASLRMLNLPTLFYWENILRYDEDLIDKLLYLSGINPIRDLSLYEKQSLLWSAFHTKGAGRYEEAPKSLMLVIIENRHLRYAAFKKKFSVTFPDLTRRKYIGAVKRAKEMGLLAPKVRIKRNKGTSLR